MEIKIENCNNIDNGNISVHENRLNIKYGNNGAGKSTIAKAILLKSRGEDLTTLKPFKHANTETVTPNVTINGTMSKALVFDEKYIDSFLFKKTELLENSFEIFVKTDKYDENMNEINDLILGIKKAFSEDEELEKFIQDLTKFIDSFGNTQNGYSKSANLAKSIGNGNKLENIPDELKDYEPYIRMEGLKNLKWLKWQSEGEEYLEVAEKCPYCVSELTTSKEVIRSVSKEYEVKTLKVLCEMLEVFNSLSQYFTQSTKETIQTIIKSANAITNEHIEYLKRLKDEVKGLKEKLNWLKNAGFNALKDVDRVVDQLNAYNIQLSLYPQLNSDYTKAKVGIINDSLNEVIGKAGQLQGKIAIQRKEIEETIRRYSAEINSFLTNAGYTYFVTIEPTTDERYRLILKSTEGAPEISNAKEHLSFGERNAFSLVLFMYQALRDNIDFIILDDPISSFDKNKKYAIMDMLFRGRGSLQGKTVLMLTHDLEPVIDAIYNMASYFTPNAKASFISNENNAISEKEIEKNDIKSCIDICKSNIKESDDMLHKLIYYRRLLEMENEKNLAWELVSNVFHKGRDIPQILDETKQEMRDMVSDEINYANSIIRIDIPDFDYSGIYNRTKDKKDMIKAYENSKSGYEKVQIYRILQDGALQRGSALKKYVDETFHVQNDYLFQLNPREFEIVPQYILEVCNKDIEQLVGE